MVTLNPEYNAKLEAAMLVVLNNYRTHYGLKTVSVSSAVNDFAHKNVEFNVDPANEAIVEQNPHYYFENNRPSTGTENTYFSTGIEVGQYLSMPAQFVSSSVLGSAANVKDTLTTKGGMNYDDLNNEAIQNIAYSLIMQYGDDGQPVGYDGTTAATQGSAHKQALLKANLTSVGFGVGFNANGMLVAWIDGFQEESVDSLFN
jgi:hypothetical protein